MKLKRSWQDILLTTACRRSQTMPYKEVPFTWQLHHQIRPPLYLSSEFQNRSLSLVVPLQMPATDLDVRHSERSHQHDSCITDLSPNMTPSNNASSVIDQFSVLFVLARHVGKAVCGFVHCACHGWKRLKLDKEMRKDVEQAVGS